jgi:hypothetical protein
MQVSIHYFEIAGGGNVAGAHPPFPRHIQSHFAGSIRLGPDTDAFDIEEQFYNLLFDPVNGCILMDHIIDFDPSYGTAVGGTEQYPAQRVSDG